MTGLYSRKTTLIHDEENTLGVSRGQKAANQGRAEKRLARASGHLKEEFPLALAVELLRHLLDGLDLVTVELDFRLEWLQVIRPDVLRHKRAGRL
jgi:hypothetical protein